MNIAILHAGGLGDLVLAETLFAGLRGHYPGAQMTLYCRSDVAPVASLYAHPPDAVHTFAFNPYLWARPADAATAIAPFLAAIPRESVDLFISAELKSTWLGEVLAAALLPRDAIVAGADARPQSDLLILLRALGLPRNAAVHRPPPITAEHELDRYARLAGGLRRFPTLRRDGRHEAAEGPTIVVFPAGAPELKRWSRSSLREAIARIAVPRRAKVVLVGAASERRELEMLSETDDGGLAWEVVAGAPDELPRIASLIANANGYLGIDTGLAHLAAAYGVPGVTVYGGGTWPSYAPWSTSSAGVVAPIPCFGCHWDCAFDRAFCIERIGVDPVVAAFEQAFERPADGPFTVVLKAYNGKERTILGAAAAVHRTAQIDRAARLRAIFRLQDVLHRYIRRAWNRQARSSAALTEMSRRVAAAARRLTARSKSP